MQTSIMPSARSGSVNSVSRWSTRPESTRVRQVPQKPGGADAQHVVHLDGSSTALGNAAHCNAVGVAAGGVTAQRVLADSTTGQLKIEVSSGTPGWQLLTIGTGQGQGYHILVLRDDAAVHHGEADASVTVGRRRRPPQRAGQFQQPRHDGIRQRDQHIVA